MLDFLEYVWWMPGPLLVGRHTRAIADRLTRAVDDFLNGRSTFLVVSVPFRHGKSDLVSRALPAYFLGRAIEGGEDPDVIMSGYGASLVQGFSRKAKSIVRSEAFRALWPGVELSSVKDAVDKWALEGKAGEVTAVGLGGAITGTGGHLITCDDYCKNREEAESETYRRRVWESFKDDLMTRRAPTSLVVICATRWHTDDLIGRIMREMEENPDFPRFEFLSFPYKDDDGGYLFPERFTSTWYQEQEATLGVYSTAALLACDPTMRGGNLFRMDGVQVHNDVREFPECRYVRSWDLASSEKQRSKDDPDWTVGALTGSVLEGGAWHLWVKDVKAVQEEAPARDALIKRTAMADGPGVTQLIESVAGYKDAYTTLRDVLKGIRTVRKVGASSDKVVRAAVMEPLFDAGHVHILRADWNALFEKHFREFPKGKHDDVVDSVGAGYRNTAKAPAIVRVM